MVVFLSLGACVHRSDCDALAPSVRSRPIATVEGTSGETVVLTDIPGNGEPAGGMTSDYEFLYIVTFIVEVMDDMGDELNEEKLRGICRTHLSSVEIEGFSWKNTFVEDSKVFTFFRTPGAERSSSETKFLCFERCSGKTSSVKIISREETPDRVVAAVPVNRILDGTEKEKAEKVLAHMSQYVSGLRSKSIAGYEDIIMMKNPGARNSLLEDYWERITRANNDDPEFNPGVFAREFRKFYPQPDKTAVRIFKYVIDKMGQGEYYKVFLKVYIDGDEDWKYRKLEPDSLKGKLPTMKFRSDISGFASSERSLQIMEYLNRELAFIPESEMCNLKEAAELIQKAVLADTAEEPLAVSRLADRVHAAAMGEEIPENSFPRYRKTDCESTGRPRIFPSPVPVRPRHCIVIDMEVSGRSRQVVLPLTDFLREAVPDLTGFSQAGPEENGINAWSVEFMKNISRPQEDIPHKEQMLEMSRCLLSYMLENTGKAYGAMYTSLDVEKGGLFDLLGEYVTGKYMDRGAEEKGSTHAPAVRGICFMNIGLSYIDLLMKKLDERVHSSDFRAQHPIIQAAEVYLKLIDIHPYSDGNERTARFIMNYMLMRNGLPYFEVYPYNREEFIRTVRFTRDKFELGLFLAEHLMAQNQYLLKDSKEEGRIASFDEVMNEHSEVYTCPEEMHEAMVGELRTVIERHQAPVIMTSFGKTMQNFYYGHVLEKAKLPSGDPGHIDLSGTIFILTDEFPGTLFRYREFIKFCAALPGKNRPAKIISFRSAENDTEKQLKQRVVDFNKKLAGLPSIDLALTSIGVNGHIAYNEIGCEFYSKGRIIKLHKSSREHSGVPYTRAFTVGINDILKADRIVVTASSKTDNRKGVNGALMSKAEAMESALTTLDVPASFVKMHPKKNFVYMMDEDLIGEDIAWLIKHKNSILAGKNIRGEINFDPMLDRYLSSAHTFNGFFRELPYDPAYEDDTLLFVLDTSWIPRKDWVQGLLNEIRRISGAKIKFVVGEGPGLERFVIQKMKKESGSRTRIILMGNASLAEQYAEMLDTFTDQGTDIFTALVDNNNLKGLDQSAEVSYLMLLDWIKAVIRMSEVSVPSSVSVPGLEGRPKEISERVWLIVPRANMLPLDILPEVYAAQEKIIRSL
jgi:6-phosphogluconolactonase/glucosamine-6-phosphate isomerase/deaminase